MKNLIGTYSLINLFDAQKNTISFPTDRVFTIKIDDNGNESFSFLIHLGNNLRSNFFVKEDNSISFGLVLTTRMYPGPELAQVETAVHEILSECTQVNTNQDDHILFTGSAGTLEMKANPSMVES